MPKKSLIYIIGAGRSGTTLLDIVLGNADDVISLGEINRFFKRDGIPPKRDEKDKVFRFWESIRTDLEDRNPNLSYPQSQSLFKKNEYHSRLIKSLLKKNEHSYVTQLLTLNDIIFSKTNENVLIESSKYPLRALNLSNYLDPEKVELKFIYIKKDPVKVVRSFGRKNLEQPSKGFLSANLYYLVVNLICELTFWKLKKRHKTSRIKFEELMDNPVSVLGELEKDLHIDLNKVRAMIEADTPMNTGFLFDGNRIRLKESLLLQSSEAIEKKSMRNYLTRVFNLIIYRP